MTTNAYFEISKVIRRLHDGPLGDYVDLYAAQLLRERRCYQSGARCIRIAGDFSQRLVCKHVDVREVDEHLVVQYLRFRAQCQQLFCSDRRALQKKMIRYSHLVANHVILYNANAMTKTLRDLKKDGLSVTPEVLKGLSPYRTEHINLLGATRSIHQSALESDLLGSSARIWSDFTQSGTFYMNHGQTLI